MNRFVRLAGLVALAAWPSAVTPGQPPRSPTDAEVAEQIGRLDPKHGKEDRLKALRWINGESHHGNVAVAAAALERCVRDDPAWEVRQAAVNCLAHVAGRNGKPCPLAVFEALHDREDFVRYQAGVSIATFKAYPPGAADVLFRGAAADNPELRGTSLLLLARVAGKEPKALRAMEAATRDKDFDVRDCAHLARFIATDELGEYLTYLIRLREDPAAVLSPGPEDSPAGKRERALRNLVVLGSGSQLIEWSEGRADELAGVLMKLLRDESAVRRRGAANLIGASAVKVELPARRGVPAIGDPPPLVLGVDGSYEIGPDGTPRWVAKDKKKEAKDAPPPPQKSKVAARLEVLGVEAALGKLRDGDPDRSVRDAARGALERLASVKGDGKKP
jgi:hypothetical protein